MKETKAGQPFKSCTLDGKVFGKDKFNLFQFHTRYADIVVGSNVEESDIVQDGQYIKLRDPDEGIKGRGGKRGGPNPMDIAMAQERTAENVKAAQDNKDFAIRQSSSMAHAVTIVTTFNKELPPDEIKTKIINWRNWFLDNWDIDKNEIDPSEIPF